MGLYQDRKVDELSDEMNDIQRALSKAASYDTKIEVIHAAMIAMRNNPQLSIKEAFDEGLLQWDITPLCN